MPKSTFFNLPEEKRKKIIDCAKKEFSKYSFYDVSIKRVIKDAGVSRGSFYQYFENKEDLFIYLLDSFKDKVIETVKNKIDTDGYDIFEIQLAIFDYITNEGMKSDDRDLIITFISNLDIKFGSHLIKYIKAHESLSDRKYCISVDSINNIKIKTEKEFMALRSIVFSSLINELTAYFIKEKTLEECREELIIISSIVKYGISKE